MKLRKSGSPLLLLLLHTLAHTVAGQQNEKAVAREPEVPKEYPIVPTSPNKPKSKEDVGTKDAPVDGLDGKPHDGPFLESSGKKLSQDVEDLAPKIPPPAPGSKQLVEEDGVMNDHNRPVPKEGTTGTEGGVSEKDREAKVKEDETGSKPQKVPEQPKEVPTSKEPSSKGDVKGGNKPSDGDEPAVKEKLPGAAGLEKPQVLPETPYDLPVPEKPRVKDDSSLDDTPPTHPKYIPDSSFDDPTGVIQPFHSFILSLAMILVSEIGDKTFLVAALMAMRHDRLVVFSAAFTALIAMTVLSAVLGHAVPTLLPKRFTNFLAAVLFLVFGARLFKEGYAMDPNEGVGEEMKEVEAELEEKESLAARRSRRRSDISPFALESGRGRPASKSTRLPAPARSPSSSPSRSPSPSRRRSIKTTLGGLNNLLSLLLSPAWVQTFVMTFLGEWGDRSQIATIAMAAGSDYWWVTAGAVCGHAMCTGVAVVGGRAIAGRVSMRVVTLGGAVAFVVFGVIYMIEAAYSD